MVDDHMRGLVLIGADGLGNAYGLDLRDEGGAVVNVPLIGMEWALASRVADSFEEFVALFLRDNTGLGAATR